MQMAELCKNIRELKSILYGNSDSEPVAEACAQLTQEFFRENTLRLLIVCLPKLNLEVILLVTMFDLLSELRLFFFHGSSVIIFYFFILYNILIISLNTQFANLLLKFVVFLQARKDATQVVANLQRQQVHSRLIASDYLEANKDLLDLLISGWDIKFYSFVDQKIIYIYILFMMLLMFLFL